MTNPPLILAMMIKTDTGAGDDAELEQTDHNPEQIVKHVYRRAQIRNARKQVQRALRTNSTM
jgi:hypothetical protein